MFKKLKIKFVSIVMASVAIVLAIVFTGICAVEYQRSASDVDEALNSAIDRTEEHLSRDFFGFESIDIASLLGRYDMLAPFSQWQEDSSSNAVSSSNGFSGDGNGGLSPSKRNDASDGRAGASENGADGDLGSPFFGPRIGGPQEEERLSVPVAVYALASDSSLQLVSNQATASLDEELLNSAYERLSAVEDGAGTLGDLGLHYRKKTLSTTTLYAFADTSNTSSWQSLATILAIAGLGTLAVFLFIALGLANWALKPVKEAWDSQRQFVADASHDLKTPLTVILANSSILLKHPERSIASESQWIESTQVEAKHMQALVNEMLELAQVEAGQQTQIPHELLDFSDLVDGETLLFDSVALERNCTFACSIDEGISVNGNRQQLSKMVATIVENAFKYVDDGGSIEVDLTRDTKRLSLSISNTGSGIAPEDLPHIFDRFYRTDKARTSGTGGFGLGLAIAREIARSHGGDITCTSTPNTNTTFTITLPTA